MRIASTSLVGAGVEVKLPAEVHQDLLEQLVARLLDLDKLVVAVAFVQLLHAAVKGLNRDVRLFVSLSGPKSGEK
jgi:hypothetical protein